MVKTSYTCKIMTKDNKIKGIVNFTQYKEGEFNREEGPPRKDATALTRKKQFSKPFIL